MKCSVHFPVQPHVLKYLRHRFGEIFIYNNASSIAPIIRAAISETSTSDISPFQTIHHYEVQLTERYHQKFNVFYSRKKVFQFNADIDAIFREELYRFMLLNKLVYNIQYRTSFRDFLESINITEEDIKFETLLKQFYRHHTKKDEKKQGTAA